MTATAPKRQLHPFELRGFRSSVRVGPTTKAVGKYVRKVMPLAAEDGVIAHAIDAHAQTPQLEDRLLDLPVVGAWLVGGDHNHHPATLFRGEPKVAIPLAGRKGRGKHIFDGCFLVAVVLDLSDRL